MKGKKTIESKKVKIKGAHIASAGILEQQLITKTLESNYMPYAMSVILSRALPQIDGFKPSHRKLLYTMFKMGLLSGKLTKSANIVGATMKLNPHGDAAIYETMVRLSRGQGALLVPLIESKGNFGKFFSRDMAYAASRYTEAKLAPVCSEIFSEIEEDAVDFVDNYDNSTVEPVLLPVKFPTILVNANIGIAVSMASSICSFNLVEICKTTIKLIKGEKFNILSCLKGPDFPGGGIVIKNSKVFREIYETGRGSFKLRSCYKFDKKNNCVDIFEIPYTTTVEAIIDKVVELVKQTKIKEIADIRDETDLNGLKLTIDLKRGTNPDELMNKLFKLTPLEDSFACNFNVLIEDVPKVLGVREILDEWLKFRQSCVKRRIKFEIDGKEKRLHLIKGLNKILLDIDGAIEIIRKTEKEDLVITNLMAGFKIDFVQAEFVAQIRLKNLNKQFILKKVEEKDFLEKELKRLKEILNSIKKINEVICSELEQVIEKFGQPRKTKILDSSEIETDDGEMEDGSLKKEVVVFVTKDGYVKKVSPLAVKTGKNAALKEEDSIIKRFNVSNESILIFFSNKGNSFNVRVSEIKEVKLSSLGEFIPAKLKFVDDEKIIDVFETVNFDGYVLFFYENGSVSRVPLSSYSTKRTKLINAFSLSSEIVAIHFEEAATDYAISSSDGRKIVFNSSLVTVKKTKGSRGVSVMKMKKGSYLKRALKLKSSKLKEAKEFEVTEIPSMGKKTAGTQLKLDI